MPIDVDLILSQKKWITSKQAQAQLRFNEWNESKNAVILDTETTGLYDAEIVEICVIDLDGNILLNTLVKPKNEIPSDAVAIHGITDEMVGDAPIWPEVWEKLYRLIKNKKILIYNSDFDIRLMWESFHPWDEIGEDRLDELADLIFELDAHCVMKTYASLVNSPKWLKLEEAAGRKIAHRALDDCNATLEVVRKAYQPGFTQLDYHRALIYEKYLQANNEINWITDQLERLLSRQRQLMEERQEYLGLLLSDERLQEYITITTADTAAEIAATIDEDEEDLPF